ncbi:hypothetical protein E2C01_031826 [Portunus trituberculatus]|uniref:Uncharacterized protein n=1 Tax=Portunus trituberculatus TaxID=210409 RepID=A0A5B7ETU5_PORTR|nr:hypothetical protein [Portunus trituberculatus]
MPEPCLPAAPYLPRRFAVPGGSWRCLNYRCPNNTPVVSRRNPGNDPGEPLESYPRSTHPRGHSVNVCPPQFLLAGQSANRVGAGNVMEIKTTTVWLGGQGRDNIRDIRRICLATAERRPAGGVMVRSVDSEKADPPCPGHLGFRETRWGAKGTPTLLLSKPNDKEREVGRRERWPGSPTFVAEDSAERFSRCYGKCRVKRRRECRQRREKKTRVEEMMLDRRQLTAGDQCTPDMQDPLHQPCHHHHGRQDGRKRRP